MNWIIIIISIILAAFGVYKEVHRANRAHLVLRIIATLVAVAALACLILPISYKSSVQTNSGSITLLTPGFNADSLKSEGQKVYTLDSGVAKAYPKAKLLYSLGELFTDSAAKPTIHIYGSGLNSNILKGLGNTSIAFHPSPIPDGITAVNWTETVSAGSPLQVQGTIKNAGKPIRLLLKGLNTLLDSTKIEAGASVSFAVTTIPKHAGKAVYILTGVREKDTLFTEQLPVTIQPTQPLKVLELAASPDFEDKFLRTWLGNNNYAVASRSIITKGKYGQDYINMERMDLSNITAGLLSKFDVVEADLSAIKALSPPESAALQQEVNSKGLGLIIRADTVDDKNPSWVQNSFKVLRSPKQPATELFIQGKKANKIAVDGQYIGQQNNIQPIATDAHGNMLAAATLSGAGKVVFSTINNSYSWMLAGNHDDYFALWSALISKAARKAVANSSWLVATQFPNPGEPITLLYHGASPNGTARINQAQVAPAQNPGIPFEWSFTYRPRQIGWQQANVAGGTSYSWYVWPKDSWQSLKATQNSRLTQKFAKSIATNSLSSASKPKKVDVEVSKFYFYILFLLAACFLWAETKYQQQTN